ncbi:transcription regulator AbrB [Desulfocucumis palustris]|uniref:Transcription regulator AbrB n=2 Tax=Desulfocucumis palustris TaxID=1898651 RepID=A0A2L2XCQ1_9FIRM|nr:transcription regulator AbrB [Desulfocucumis palustris]
MRHKVISKGGGLIIPADIRRQYNFLSGAAVDIAVKDGCILVSQHTPRCIFCNNHEGVGKHMDRYVCKACVTAMVKDVGTIG